MSKKILQKSTIFVEGAEDSRFLQDVIEAWYGITLSAPSQPHQEPKAKGEAGLVYDFVSYGGKTHIAKAIPLFQNNTSNGLKNILFMDADSVLKDKKWGGLKNTRTYLQDLRKEMGITIDLAYIFPNAAEIPLNDNEHDEDAEGALETILTHIATEQDFLRCWGGFCSCLEAHNAKSEQRYKMPDDKFKFFSYVDTVTHGKKESGGTKRQYQNALWNLDYTSEEQANKRYLKPLKQFLDKIMQLEQQQ